MVGLTEDQAIEKYGKENILIGRNSFTGNGRAIASNEAHGFVKVIADKKYHEILGVHIIGPVAAEMINEAATIMESELTVDDVAKINPRSPNLLRGYVRGLPRCSWCSDSQPTKT